jgi:hypothetical protein
VIEPDEEWQIEMLGVDDAHDVVVCDVEAVPVIVTDVDCETEPDVEIDGLTVPVVDTDAVPEIDAEWHTEMLGEDEPQEVAV